MPEDDSSSRDWKLVSQEVIYQCLPFLSLQKQVILLPDGRKIDDYHYLQMPEASVISAMTADDKVILLEGYKHGPGRISTFLPGGQVDDGETPLLAAQRELLEETGYESDHWFSLGSYVPHSNYGCGRAHLFRAMNARRVSEPNSGDLGETEVRVLDFNNILKLVKQGKIDSLSTVAAIMLTVHLAHSPSSDTDVCSC
jgi:ADP-ribose pyrophosphatase